MVFEFKYPFNDFWDEISMTQWHTYGEMSHCFTLETVFSILVIFNDIKESRMCPVATLSVKITLNVKIFTLRVND